MRGFDSLTKIIYMSTEKKHDEEAGLVLEVAKPKLERPSMYTVVLLNDDYTPMDFVVHVLQVYFNMAADQAVRIMLDVHQKGAARCGVYTRDVAETKAVQVVDFARQNDHPLLCRIEKI